MAQSETKTRMESQANSIIKSLSMLSEGYVRVCETGEFVNDTGEYDRDDVEDFYDYIMDNLGMSVTIGLPDKDYESCLIVMACGGPNIYIDTDKGAVLGYWGSEHVEVPIPSGLVRLIDETVEEVYKDL